VNRTIKVSRYNKENSTNGDLGTDRGKAVGIGTINILNIRKNGKVLPVFSFVVLEGNKEEASPFIATCIDLRIDGYGNSDLAAIENMNNNVVSFLAENFTNPKCRDSAWDNLERLARFDDWSKELWNIYRAVQYKFAEKNKVLYTMSLMAEKAKPSGIKNKKREVVVVSPQGAKFANIAFDRAENNISASNALAWDSAILGQTATLKGMKISPWLQQPIEGKKRCIQPLPL